MADQSDVLAAIEQAVAAALPFGQTPPVSIIQGWPTADLLKPVAAGSRVLVSIAYREGMTRNQTRYLLQEHELAPVPPGLTFAVSARTVTFGGAPLANDVAGIALGGYGYAYRCAATTMPSDVAAALGAVIPGATVSGASVIAPAAPIANVLHDGATTCETLRIEEGYTISVWSNDPAVRDRMSARLTAILAAITWLALPNEEAARFRFAQTVNGDRTEAAGLFKRDIIFLAEYPVSVLATVPRALFIGGPSVIAGGICFGVIASS